MVRNLTGHLVAGIHAFHYRILVFLEPLDFSLQVQYLFADFHFVKDIRRLLSKILLLWELLHILPLPFPPILPDLYP